MKTCKQCNSVIIGKGGQFCSRKCHYDSMSFSPNKCLVCNEPCKEGRTRSKYCSNKCYLSTRQADKNAPRPTPPEGQFFIPLTKGNFARVDLIDSDLDNFSWFTVIGRNTSYARRYGLDGESYKDYTMSNIIYERAHGKIKEGSVVDHIDCDGLNNTRSNLRLATVSQNTVNMKRTDKPEKLGRSGRNSKYCGVQPVKNRWKAQYRYKCYGYFLTEEEAARARDDAVRADLKRKSFVRYNFPREGERPAFDDSVIDEESELFSFPQPGERPATGLNFIFRL